jgi:hypothetical protein
MPHLMMRPWPDDGADAAYTTEAPNGLSDDLTHSSPPDRPVERVAQTPVVICPGRDGQPHYLVPTTDGHGFCAFCRFWVEDHDAFPPDAAPIADTTIIAGIWGEDL